MSQVNIYLLTYLLTGMLVLVGNETISAQPPVYYFNGQTSLPCGSNGCEIKIGYNITATDFSQTTCGMWKLSATWYVIDDPCNKLISVQNFKWKNVTTAQIGADLYGETAHGQNTEYHLPYQTTFQMQFIFSATTSCIAGNETSSHSYSFQLSQSAYCGWCQSRFCVNTFTCADEEEDEWRADMISLIRLWDGINNKDLYNALGFNFSYAAYITWPCNNYLQKPTFIDLAADLNNWLKNNGKGFAVIKYMDAGDPNYNLCKIQFKLRSPKYVLKEIRGYSRWLENCQMEDFICQGHGLQAHIDSTKCFNSLRSAFNDSSGSHYENNTQESFGVVILPTITSDQMKINIKSISDTNYNIRILGMDGKEYLFVSQADPERIYNLSLGHLEPGMYFLNVQDIQTGLIKVERIIKQ